MESLGPLISWARTRGVELDGIAPQQMPGRGIGAVATRSIKAGQVLMTIPAGAILRLDSVPASISSRLPSASIHGLLAAQLAAGCDAETALRRDAMPSLQSFAATTPLFWHRRLRDLLPAGARRLVARQETALERDWAAFHEGFPGVARDAYLRCWFLVGTRAFYHETDATLGYPWEDRLALLPVADMFNHAGVPGCAVAFSPEAYTVTATRACARGDEVFLSYGEHSNDFLLAEYGFLLDDNPWDTADLGAFVLSGLDAEQQAELRARGFDECVVGPGEQWHLPDGALDILGRHFAGEPPRRAANGGRQGKPQKERVLAAVLTRFLDEIRDVKSAIRAVTVGDDAQCATLLRRWDQIEALVKRAIRGVPS
ncbi:hypothetical protein H634G_09325 [Metarhizium anisopliae BRIP 53293]|uniref:SET domain-containing protein n=1 Tax=Metarhizium anisopliae BRIP 53293 TaxID=1291518 RepID=A0A0D9NMK0_METAN|nr:hypothetical protein H634G_09325 [Metarhizium anisopliae BRIP 53293]